MLKINLNVALEVPDLLFSTKQNVNLLNNSEGVLFIFMFEFIIKIPLCHWRYQVRLFSQFTNFSIAYSIFASIYARSKCILLLVCRIFYHYVTFKCVF